LGRVLELGPSHSPSGRPQPGGVGGPEPYFEISVARGAPGSACCVFLPRMSRRAPLLNPGEWRTPSSSMPWEQETSEEAIPLFSLIHQFTSRRVPPILRTFFLCLYEGIGYFRRVSRRIQPTWCLAGHVGSPSRPSRAHLLQLCPSGCARNISMDPYFASQGRPLLPIHSARFGGLATNQYLSPREYFNANKRKTGWRPVHQRNRRCASLDKRAGNVESPQQH